MFPEKVRILLAIESAALRQEVRELLASTNFQIEDRAKGSWEAEKIQSDLYNLVLLGIGREASGAIEACRRLRSLAPRIGVIAVPEGCERQDEITVLEAGANDCLAPPFRFRELVGRLGAVLRSMQFENPKTQESLRAGNLEVDIVRRLCLRSGKSVRLSPKEFELLVILMTNPEIALPHAKLMRKVWGEDSARGRIYLRAYVKALRRKLEADPARPRYILTEPWVGYRFHNPG